MRTVRDADGHRYILLKRSAESSLVHDPAVDDTRYLPNDDIEPVEESPLEAAAGAIPGSVRTLVGAVREDRHLGLMLEIDRRGPVAVRDLLDAYELCESDLNGLLGELRVAGLIEETDVGSQRYYRTTDEASDALVRLRE